MNYQASVTDFFKPQKWGMNMLLGAVCILIPMIGQVILTGWAITQLWGRGDEEKPSDYPPFDFQYFTKYLMRGLWPFLVQMACSVVIMPVMIVVMYVILMMLFATIMITGPEMQNNEAASIMMMCFAFGAYAAVFLGMMLVTMLVLNFILVPLSIAATLAQDFVPAFNLAFVRNFLALVWKDLLLTTLFLYAISIVMIIVAICTCYIGAFALSPVVIFAWHHLQKQLYLLHVARGGMVLPRSPKLNDLPPGLPPSQSA